MSDSRGQRSVVGSQGNQSSLENKTFTENRHKNNKKKIVCLRLHSSVVANLLCVSKVKTENQLNFLSQVFQPALLELLKLIHNGLYGHLDTDGCFCSSVLVPEILYLKHQDIRKGLTS